MLLCLDVGNSQIYAGVFDQELVLQFRYNSYQGFSSDQLGIFIKDVLREHNIDAKKIKDIAVCSVVPAHDYSVRAACQKYFQIDPLFLKASLKTGLNMRYINPGEIGADRIANSIAAIDQFPNQNIIIVDLGTATTICAINRLHEYLGGAILPGFKTSAKALQDNTAKLPAVDITKPAKGLGQSTIENIKIGLFYGQLGAIKETVNYISHHAFNGQKADITIGTGGFSYLFKDDKIFDYILPNLVLKGLYKLNYLNSSQ